MHGAAANNYPRVVNLLANRGADPKVWSKPNKSGRTPLYIAEGYRGVELGEGNLVVPKVVDWVQRVVDEAEAAVDLCRRIGGFLEGRALKEIVQPVD